MVIGIDARHLQEKERSGVGIYTHHLLHALCSDANWRHDYLLYNNSFFSSAIFFENKDVSFVRTHWPNALLHPAIRFFGRPKIDRMIEKKIQKKVAVFYSPNLHFTALEPGTRHVLTIHDLSFELYQECYSKKRQFWHRLVQPQRQCEQAAAIIVPSWQTKEDVVRLYHIHPQKIHVIYPGIPEYLGSDAIAGDELKKKYHLPEHFFLFIGTMEPRKNIEGVILAYQQSELFAEGIYLVFAGAEGWKCQELMRLMKKTSGVRYIGYVDDREKNGLYALSRVCLFPSFYEGFGFPVVEAMQAGIPVITSDRSSLPEVACAAAYLVNPYRVGEIAEAMRLLAYHEPLRGRLIAHGRQVSANYSWTKAAGELLAIFDSLT